MRWKKTEREERGKIEKDEQRKAIKPAVVKYFWN